ncbi:type I-G CRISPR-associated protein Csb2 [Xanthobacter sediminis]
MTLLLEIDHLTGHAYAAVGPDSEVPDWPPQPDRVFSALVASWAARGALAEEAAALRWLEAQATPVLLVSDAEARTTATVFVPPNDARNGEKESLPALRRRQPRRFPAAVPHDPRMGVLWPDAEPEEQVFSALDALARDTSHIGHSASLTRCRFLRGAPAGAPAPVPPQRRIYPGRFDELLADHARGQRPSPGAPVRLPEAERADKTPRSVFSENWLLLERAGGRMPDVRASTVVAKAIRDTLLKGYDDAGAAIPAAVSGHEADGAPARAPHLAILALPFAGFAHADGRLMGFALVPPRGLDLLEDEAFRAAVRAKAPFDPDRGLRILSLKSQRGSAPLDAFALELTPVSSGRVASVNPALYVGPARTFGTVTPIALDRHPKQSGAALDEEIEAIIKQSCVHIGLPEPEKVVPGKHSALEGTAPAWPSGGNPRWMGWRRPDSLRNRPLVHAVIHFTEEVRGPVILGAGRFMGLGLCRPLDPEAGP